MADRLVAGQGPVAFFTDQGQQQSIPLSSLRLDDNNNVKVDGAVPVGQLATWLKYLVSQGRLWPIPDPPAGAAMKVTAAQDGSTGNTIVVTVATALTDPTLLDVKIVETDVYTGVVFNAAAASANSNAGAANYLPNVLGIVGGATGSKPGLVRVVGPITAPVDPDPAGAVARTGTTKPRFAVPAGGGGTAFTLEARADDTATPPAVWTAKVRDLQADQTFTLEVTWQRVVPAIGATQLQSLVNAFAFAVRIEAPTGGLKLPALGMATLAGGADAAGPVAATATLLARA